LEELELKKPMKIFLLPLFTCVALFSYSQNLTGFWKGTITSESNGTTGSVQQLEMNIIDKGSTLEGCSHDYTIGRQDYCRASLKGTFDKSSGVVKTYGIEFLEKRSANGIDHVLFNARLVYRKVDDKEMLVGRMIDDNEGLSSFFFTVSEKIVLYKVGPLPNPKDKCYFEHIDGPMPKKPQIAKKTTATPKTLKVVTPPPKAPKSNQKVPDPVVKNTNPAPKPSVPQKPVVVKKPAVVAKNNTEIKPKTETVAMAKIDSSKAVVNEPELVKNVVHNITQESAMRDKNVIKTISVKVPVIKIELYDNGEIDGDTVSVIHNGKVIVSHQMLTSKPITLFINVNDGEALHEITMFAHNLGKIPPNTALMIITAGNDRYELRTSQDLKKNAVVLFEYKPEK
jgi:hypothetical protein